MGRPAEIKVRVARNINFENDDLLDFEKFVGKDNVSKEIRALVRNFVEDQKKGEASSSDPLNQIRLQQETNHSSKSISRHDGINTTLDIYLLSKKDIVDYVWSINDVPTLAIIEEKSKICHRVAKNKKHEITPLYKY